MAVYIYGIKKVSYANPASSNYSPGQVTGLPDTVRGSVTLDESEGSDTSFWVDQQFTPVHTVKTEEGEMTATMQFYDMDFPTLAAIKGGTGNASGYSPASGYTSVNKYIEIETDANVKFIIYNADVQSRIVGGLSRDNMLAVEMRARPQLTTDNKGTWKIERIW